MSDTTWLGLLGWGVFMGFMLGFPVARRLYIRRLRRLKAMLDRDVGLLTEATDSLRAQNTSLLRESTAPLDATHPAFAVLRSEN